MRIYIPIIISILSAHLCSQNLPRNLTGEEQSRHRAYRRSTRGSPNLDNANRVR